MMVKFARVPILKYTIQTQRIHVMDKDGRCYCGFGSQIRPALSAPAQEPICPTPEDGVYITSFTALLEVQSEIPSQTNCELITTMENGDI